MVKKSSYHNAYKWVLFAFIILISISSYASDIVSIYDIQFTMSPGFDGTYPSSYQNKSVTVQGVVTAGSFENNRIFISSPQGGAWSALAIDGISNRVSMGDFIEVSGKVSEIMGMTVLTNTNGLRVLSRSHPIPEPINITVYDAIASEAYESVLVKISHLTCRRLNNNAFVVAMEDDTGSINIGNGFMSSLNSDLFIIDGQYSYVVGVINYSYNRFSLHPRSFTDIKAVTTGIQTTSWGKIKSLYR